MTTITVTATGICAGGNHLTFNITGDRTRTILGQVEDIKTPLTDDELESFIKVLCKLAKSGRTIAQYKTLIQAGITVTV